MKQCFRSNTINNPSELRLFRFSPSNFEIKSRPSPITYINIHFFFLSTKLVYSFSVYARYIVCKSFFFFLFLRCTRGRHNIIIKCYKSTTTRPHYLQLYQWTFFFFISFVRRGIGTTYSHRPATRMRTIMIIIREEKKYYINSIGLHTHTHI